MAKYTEEKVIYLAARDIGLHVARTEFTRDTTLSRIVNSLVSRTYIVRESEDEDSFYYVATDAGHRLQRVYQDDYRQTHDHVPDAKKMVTE